MNLTPQDLLIQEKILLAVHKWCTIEEAREKDLWYWSVLQTNENNRRQPAWEVRRIWRLTRPQEATDMSWYDIIWLPPTLSRVLTALWNEYFQYIWMIFCFENDDDWEYKQQVCMRKLLNDDGTDATLRDQSQETKDKVAELLDVK